MNKQKIPGLVTVAIFTVITIISWIAFGAVRIFQKKPEIAVPPEILAPLDPTLNKNAVDNLRQRIYFDKEQSFEIASPSATPP